MPKKLFAVTNIKTSLPGSSEVSTFNAGSEVDSSKFTKEQLLELHDQGAVEVRVVDDEKNVAEGTGVSDADKAAVEHDQPVVTEQPAASPENEIAPGEDPQARIEEANSTDSNVNTDAMSNAPDPDAEDGAPTN